MIGNKNETDFCISDRDFIHEVESRMESSDAAKFETHKLDYEFYMQLKNFALTSKYRGFNIRFNYMQENFYALSYDGDIDGRDYASFLEYKASCSESDSESKSESDEEKWDFELRFDHSDKNKAMKGANGDYCKKESCFEIDDKEYYDLINTKEITCKHVITLLTLRVSEYWYWSSPSWREKKKAKEELVNKVGDRYPIKTLKDIRKYMPMEGQFVILVHTKAPETDLITKMSVHLVERENHYMYYFNNDRDRGLPLMRVIPVPEYTMNPVDRELHSDEGAYESGFAMYEHGVIFAGGQNFGSFLNYGWAKEDGVKIPDDILEKK